jgi:hypothetical protein
MTLHKLLEMISTMFEVKDKQGPVEIKARLVWRDEHGGITKVRMADFGHCSGLRNEMTVEMNTETEHGLRWEDKLINEQ